jgi:hypothetical protein
MIKRGTDMERQQGTKKLHADAHAVAGADTSRKIGQQRGLFIKDQRRRAVRSS